MSAIVRPLAQAWVAPGLKTTMCPICGHTYPVIWRKSGAKCGSLGLSQERGCVGRVIPSDLSGHFKTGQS
jgi:hypothetical protein